MGEDLLDYKKFLTNSLHVRGYKIYNFHFSFMAKKRALNSN